MRKKINWTVLLASLALVGTVLVLFAQTCGFDFVNLDDHSYTFLCPFVKDGFSLQNLLAAFSHLCYAAIWMPVTYVSYMIDISLFGPGPCPGVHHAVNVVLHALNAVLLFRLLLLLARGRSSADRPLPRASLVVVILATAFWALHPLRVEPVAWISGRKELLCGTFTLLGLILWGHGRRVWGGVCCALACLSKSTAMCFPFLALAIDGLLPETGQTDNSTPRRSNLRRILPYLPLVLMSLVTGAVAVYSHRYPENYPVQVDATPVAFRLVHAIVSAGVYLYQMFVPVGLHVDLRHPVDTVPTAWLGMAAGGFLIVLALIVLAGLFLAPSREGVVRRGWARWGHVFWCALFFAAAIGPVLGVFGSFGRSVRADRFTYLPSMAISLLAVAWCARAQGRRVVEGGLGGLLLVLLLPGLIIAIQLIPTWRNDHALFSRVLACDDSHPRALSHVASAECLNEESLGEGIRHFRASLEGEWNVSVAIKLMVNLSYLGNHLRGQDEFGNRMGTRDEKGGIVDTMSIRRRYADEIARLHARISDQMAAEVKAGREFRLSLDMGSCMYEALGMAAFWDRRWIEAANHLDRAYGMRNMQRQVLGEAGGGAVLASDEVRLYQARALVFSAYGKGVTAGAREMRLDQVEGILRSLAPVNGHPPEGVRPDVSKEAARQLYRIERGQLPF